MCNELVLSIIAGFVFALVMASTFAVSLPSWCANPTGSGNSLVQPFCR